MDNNNQYNQSEIEKNIQLLLNNIEVADYSVKNSLELLNLLQNLLKVKTKEVKPQDDLL